MHEINVELVELTENLDRKGETIDKYFSYNQQILINYTVIKNLVIEKFMDLGILVGDVLLLFKTDFDRDAHYISIQE